MSKHFVLIGHPVGHSVSPQIHGAAYRAFGLPHVYSTVDCPTAADVERQVLRLRNGEIAGANVTVPWKRLALQLADELDGSAEDTQAANVLVCTEAGTVRAYNTDAGALAERLAAGARGRLERVVVLGNGGAGLAATVAARRCGARRITVTARRWQGEVAAWPDREQFEALGAEAAEWSSEPGKLRTAFGEADVIVQATSAGMKGAGDGSALVELIPWNELQSRVFIYDVVYNPPVTPLLAQAAQSGLAHEGGLSMLIGQAALALKIWLDIDAPREAMRVAAESVLFRRAQ